MPTPTKNLTQPTVGSDNNTWGGLLNTDLALIDTALGGTLSLSISGNTTLNSSQVENTGYEFTGTISGTATISWPSFFGFASIQNNTTGGFSISCGISGGTYVTVPNGQTVIAWADGTDFASPSGSSVLTNLRQAVAGTYTVASADQGMTIAAGGTAFYAVTFAAVADYSNTFCVLVTNEDPTNCKKVVLTGRTDLPIGGNSFKLWPGQSVLIFRQGSGWRDLGRNNRWQLSGTTNFYVDPAGNDTANDGLSPGASGAFATIQEAVLAIETNVDLAGNTVNILLSAGHHTISSTVGIFSTLEGAVEFFITGAGVDVTFLDISAAVIAFFVKDRGTVTFDAFTVNFGAGSQFLVSQAQAIADLGPTALKFTGGDASTLPISLVNKGQAGFFSGTAVTIDCDCLFFLSADEESFFEWNGAVVTVPHNHDVAVAFIGVSRGSIVNLGTATFTGNVSNPGPGVFSGVTYFADGQGTNLIGDGTHDPNTTIPGNVGGFPTNGAQITNVPSSANGYLSYNFAGNYGIRDVGGVMSSKDNAGAAHGIVTAAVALSGGAPYGLVVQAGSSAAQSNDVVPLAPMGTNQFLVGLAANPPQLKSAAQTAAILTQSKIITFTRDLTAASGSVGYTGVGFKPYRLHIFGVVNTATRVQLNGFVDQTLTGYALALLGGDYYFDTSPFSIGDDASDIQRAVVASFDADGFTLTWTKTGTPSAGTATFVVECIGSA